MGDSVGNTMLGHPTTLPVTLDQMILFTQAVVRGAERALVVADLPFGSYEASPRQAVESAVRLVKESGAHAVKVEGDERFAEHVAAMTAAGVAVMAHIGFTPQSEHAMGGYRVQGRDDARDRVLADARSMQQAGAFAVVMEMVPGELATEVTATLDIPTIGIGAGAGCDAQVLVWQDLAGLRTGRLPRFVKQYAQLRQVLLDAAGTYVDEVADGTFPGPEHTF